MNIVYAGWVLDDATKITFVLRETFLFLLGVGGVIVLIAFVVAGLVYMLSGGNANMLEWAKRVCMFSIIGTIVILSTLIVFWTINSFLT